MHISFLSYQLYSYLFAINPDRCATMANETITQSSNYIHAPISLHNAIKFLHLYLCMLLNVTLPSRCLDWNNSPRQLVPVLMWTQTGGSTKLMLMLNFFTLFFRWQYKGCNNACSQFQYLFVPVIQVIPINIYNDINNLKTSQNTHTLL